MNIELYEAHARSNMYRVCVELMRCMYMALLVAKYHYAWLHIKIILKLFIPVLHRGSIALHLDQSICGLT